MNHLQIHTLPPQTSRHTAAAMYWLAVPDMRHTSTHLLSAHCTRAELPAMQAEFQRYVDRFNDAEALLYRYYQEPTPENYNAMCRAAVEAACIKLRVENGDDDLMRNDEDALFHEKLIGFIHGLQLHQPKDLEKVQAAWAAICHEAQPSSYVMWACKCLVENCLHDAQQSDTQAAYMITSFAFVESIPDVRTANAIRLFLSILVRFFAIEHSTG